MANTPQAKKRIRRNERRELINHSRISRIRTFIKAVESSGPSNPQEQCSPDDVNLCTVALVR